MAARNTKPARYEAPRLFWTVPGLDLRSPMQCPAIFGGRLYATNGVLAVRSHEVAVADIDWDDDWGGIDDWDHPAPPGAKLEPPAFLRTLARMFDERREAVVTAAVPPEADVFRPDGSMATYEIGGREILGRWLRILGDRGVAEINLGADPAGPAWFKGPGFDGLLAPLES